jgi:starch phosphorylase
MDKQGQVVKPIYSSLPVEIKGFESLAKLALDMRYSWNHAADWRL